MKSDKPFLGFGGRSGICCLLLFLVARAHAQPTPSTQPDSPSTLPSGPDISNIQYVVEYKPAVVINPLAEVWVTFFESQPEPAMDLILHKELEKQMAREEPTTDISTTAWLHRPGTNPQEDRPTGDHENYPLYVFALKKIMPFSEAEKTGKLK